MTKELTIYLAGKMGGLTFDEMNTWRINATIQLKDAAELVGCDINVINPVDYYNFEIARHQSESEIEDFDLIKAKGSDVILVNLEGLSTSDGTKIEIHDCNYNNRIPVISFGDMSFYDELHPWVKRDITRVERSIKDAVEYIRDFYMM